MAEEVVSVSVSLVGSSGQCFEDYRRSQWAWKNGGSLHFVGRFGSR
jgi:hypothetical protein